VYGVDLSVVVEEHAGYIDLTFHVDMLPRSARVVGDIDLKALAVDIGKDIELAVVVADGGCPNALSIYLFAVLEGEGGV
jgi:hypothetical protein